jgi:4-amino-4-deoxy-L-arabinose transferase-like glycosyltransferase
VQAGSKSWEAWFFGSLDSSNFITVDKPPASLWIMGFSARIFGFSSWSLLAPQALMGVGSVALVFATVRRSLVGYGAKLSALGGLLAGGILAFTPAAALMFRFDNPDAFLVLLMTAAAYFTVRALAKGSWRWLALVGVALGFAFLTKMLQGLLVLPAFALAYLFLANTTLGRRIVHLLVAAAALVVSAGWWVLATVLWPAASRPYIGGSTDNSVLNLVFGYNGFGRIFGNSGGGGGGAGATGASGSSFGGAVGLQRLFSSEMGLEISWLLPAALLALVFGGIVLWRMPRVSAARAGLVLWGGWLVVTGLVFSYMSGIVHPYYTVALAPAIAGLVGVGGVVLWHSRATVLGWLGVATMLAVSGIWGFNLLSENSDWMPWLRWTLLVLSLGGSIAFIAAAALDLKRVASVALVVGMLGGLGGTAAYSIATASVAHSGSIPSVGPTSSDTGAGGGFGGGPGGAAFGSSTSTGSLDALVEKSTARWAAAVDGSQSAASLELSTGAAVMAIGGWSSDPAPTLAQFEAWVKAGDIGYYISGGQGGGGGLGGGIGGGSSTASEIATWVAAHYTAQTIDGETVYALK